jgi:hypothetical protein
MMAMIGSSETSVLTRAKWHHIAEDGILHSHWEDLKSYINASVLYSGDVRFESHFQHCLDSGPSFPQHFILSRYS